MNRKPKFYSSKVIYKAQRGQIYDPTHAHYDCYIPAQSGSFEIADCWPCDRYGSIHPGYNVSPVPVVMSKCLGTVVGEVYQD